MHLQLQTFNLAFSQEDLRAALIISLLSVWVLVGLFFYLNRFTRRQYFTVWTAGWLFYALWLTLNLSAPDAPMNTLIFLCKQWCIAFSAVFLLWGSLSFLGLPIRQLLFGLFLAFLMAWSFVSPSILNSTEASELPVFFLLGMGSFFAAGCFYRLRKQMPYVGAGLLSLGFTFWGLYLSTYPIVLADSNLRSAGFFSAAVLQLFIAVSMIVLVLEETRHKAEQLSAEIATVRSEKEVLQGKVISAEEQCRSLYDQVRLTDGVQKAYDELRRTQASVVQQERLRALGQMASGMAHDVNNALSPISAYTELLLLAADKLPESARRYLETIQRCGDDIAHMVARMREFYRPQADTEHLAQADVNQVIEETIEMTRPRWKDLPQRRGVSIQIERELSPALPPLVCDARDLREALTNLIFNSVDAMPDGGKIIVATRSLNGTSPARLLLEVRDTGSGMDERTRQHCLEPFFSTKTQRGGTGLGLAMVYGMMRRHGGSIEIESAPGAGTCISLSFPFRENVPSTTKAPPPTVEKERALNLLCVDDEPELRALLRDCLGAFNHRVTVASNGLEGLQLFQNALRERHPFQAVITDLGMPEMDGKQLARGIKAQSPTTPVILMTGWGTMMKENGEKCDEVDALVCKPVRLQDLNSLLLRFCQ